VRNMQLGGQDVARTIAVLVLASSSITPEFGEASILRTAAMSMTSFFFRNSDLDCNVLVLVRGTF
jgi:hypothetical protein